jgi:hypothetical protein
MLASCMSGDEAVEEFLMDRFAEIVRRNVPVDAIENAGVKQNGAKEGLLDLDANP